MWCDACRSVGTIHCAHPDQCGNMRSNNAAAENWNAWLDDLPIGAEFHPAIDRLQDFIAGLAEAAEAERDAAKAKVERLGREVNVAKYGQPDFAWSVHLEAMDELQAERDRMREALEYILAECTLSDNTTPSVGAIKYAARSALKGETP